MTGDAPAATPRPPTSLEALRYRNLRTYVGSRLFSGAAMSMLRAAVLWHVYEISRSEFHLGLIGLVQFVPSLFLSLVGGAVADSYDRRRVMMVTQVGTLACGAALFRATAVGLDSLPVLYAIVFLLAIASAFENPSRQALLPQLVPRDVFPRAVPVYATAQALSLMSGPALGGIVIATRGIADVYGLQVLLTLGSLAGLLRVRPRPAEGDRRPVSVQAIREGLAFVRRQPVVLGCMTLDMFAVILGGAVALVPVYARDILAVGPTGYGILTASLEAGALLMSVVLVALRPFRRTGRALLYAVVAYGIATIVFGLSRSFPLSVAAYVAVGMADQVSVVLRSTAIQLSTPDALRGRVSSVNMIFIGASNQLGAAESGFVAALTSATFAVVSGGVGCLLVVAWIARRIPELRHYRASLPPA
ncbi:MAG: MFS transporter [Deltaproteobacteria bacterium]|nr:MAG: MFS transporter [Deltaproteobacteria bacterium]